MIPVVRISNLFIPIGPKIKKTKKLNHLKLL